MSIIDSLIGFLAPYHCLGCEKEGTLLCDKCEITEVKPLSRCYRCHRLTSRFRTCRSCRSSSPLRSVAAARSYSGVHKELISSLKFHGAQAAARVMAKNMKPLLLQDDGILVYVPTTTARTRRRGYDQAALLSRALGHESHLPVVCAIARIGNQHQVGARRDQRLTQLRRAFRVKSELSLRGRHIVLIDDVSTTGATLEAAARVLKDAGAGTIDAVVYAQAQ